MFLSFILNGLGGIGILVGLVTLVATLLGFETIAMGVSIGLLVGGVVMCGLAMATFLRSAPNDLGRAMTRMSSQMDKW